MLFTLKEIHDYRLRATDGELGEIKTFLIDDFEWTVRYLVAQIDSRDVLLSVTACGALNKTVRVLQINESKEKILNSPTFNMNQPVSREVERVISDYFEWPYYWEPGDIPTTLPGDLSSLPLIDMELEREKKIERQELIPETGTGPSEESRNPYLQSTKTLFGAAIHTTNDGRNAGKLVDIISQDDDWNILYLVIDTGGLLPGKKVLIAPSWVQQIAENGSRIDVNLKQETIRNSPEFRSVQDLASDYQDQLKDHLDH